VIAEELSARQRRAGAREFDIRHERICRVIEQRWGAYSCPS
jgi:hypothetical protein